MSGLDDLLKKATGGSGSGGLGDLLGGLAGGGTDSELGGILGGLTGGGAARGGGMGGLLIGLLPMVSKLLANGGLPMVSRPLGKGGRKRGLGGSQQRGLPRAASFWVGPGPREPITADDVRNV